MNDNERLLRDLARVLVDHYRAISGEQIPFNSRFRTVVVVGAGASNAACGLPLGDDLAKAVEEAVGKAGIPERLITAEVNRLAIVNRLGRTEFETRLLALSRFDPDTVYGVLCGKCDVRYYPSLTYEILAHLMKHGFIDAIINFNFDEVLDQAIDDELGSDQYTRIVRDGEWARALRRDESDLWRFDRPLYIKPHGTVSERASLRFTRDAYFALPPDMAGLLRVLITGLPVYHGSEGPNTPNSERIPLCILSIGHALQSFEFNIMLEDAPSGSRLYHVEYGKTKGGFLTQVEWPKMRKFAARRAIRISPDETSLDNVMKMLWEFINERAKSFTDKLSVRGVDRHELIAYLFKSFRFGVHSRKIDNIPEHKKAVESYFEDRFFVETALAIAKAKGFIDLREIYRGRAGPYYQLLRHSRGRKTRSIYYYLRKLGMERRDASGESYWHEDMRRSFGSPSASGAQSGEDIKERLTLDPKTFRDETCSHLARVCRGELSDHRKDLLGDKGNALFIKTLNSMFNGDEVEITPVLPANYMFKFEDAHPIGTIAALKQHTRNLLKGRWDLLLCVAESGEWLLNEKLNDIAASGRNTVGLIIADNVYKDTLNKEITGIQIRHLPWHLHNRHMTIRLRKNEKKGFVPDLAIYFERRYRSAHISPVVLSDALDLERVMDDFTVYWLKAERYREGKRETIELTPDQLKYERRKMEEQLSIAAEPLEAS